MITLTDYGFGPNARNQIAAAADPSPAGAVAALETFYYALNQRDIEAMAAVWSPDELAQLNNPVGGILRGGAEAVALYRRIFDSGMRLVTFGDAVTYQQPTAATFAGREIGTYAAPDRPATPLEIRTSRFFATTGPPDAGYNSTTTAASTTRTRSAPTRTPSQCPHSDRL